MNPITKNSSNAGTTTPSHSDVSQVNTSSGSGPSQAPAAGHAVVNNNYLTPPPNVPNKRIIRKITPIDPKKLQQAGLDRKIAEALSKQKSQQASTPPSQRIKKFLTKSSATVSSTAAVNTSGSSIATTTSNQQISSPAKTFSSPKTIIPPKITITGPESPSEIDKQNLEGLNSQQRLVHVKNLLNKKLLQKKNAVNNDNNVKTGFIHLKPPTMPLNTNAATTRGINSPLKVVKTLPKEPIKETPVTPQGFCKLKEPEPAATPPTKPIKTKTPQKSPQDIARKLDFQNEGSETPKIITKQQQSPQIKRNAVKILNKDINNDIPKAAIKTVNITTQQMNSPQNSRGGSNLNEANMPFKESLTGANNPPDFQMEYLKQQKINATKSSHADFNEIPKASIKSGHYQPQYSYTPYSYKQHKQAEQKIDFPEVSPLKVPFPSVNVPKETPLPTIDSFKKPYPMANAAYYDLHNHHMDKVNQPGDYINYEPTLFPQQSATTVVNNNLLNIQLPANSPDNQEDSDTAAAATTTANCLIVLENKVLSQDEMIDLTELRLSTTNTPRFINPHKPIPEVVIKQEKTDEYPATNTPENKEMLETTKQPEDSTPKVNKEPSNDVMLLTTKQNKKIIINAQKLKLPPEQLADLAKKIKERTTQSSTSVIVKSANIKETISSNKIPDIRILNTKAANRKLPGSNQAKHTAYVMPHETEQGNINCNEITNNSTSFNNENKLHNKVSCIEASRQDHNYQLNPAIKCFNNKLPKQVIQNQTPLVTKESNFDHNTITVKEEPKTLDNTDKIHTSSLISNNDQENSSYFDLNTSEYRQSAVEIVDEPVETEDCFSAVDFIASLNNIQPITEETSLELSPEELNLNASCAMNLSPLRIQSYTPRNKVTSSANLKKYSQITSTPKNEINDANEMNTIVIESSKGPETILTTDSPNKYGELQKLNRFTNLTVCDMDIEESIELSQQFVLEPLKEPQNIDLTNVIVAKDPEKIKHIISQVKNVKDFENASTIGKISSPLKGMVINPLKHKEKLNNSATKSQEKDNNLSDKGLTNISKQVENSSVNVSADSLESIRNLEQQNQLHNAVEKTQQITIVQPGETSKVSECLKEKQSTVDKELTIIEKETSRATEQEILTFAEQQNSTQGKDEQKTQETSTIKTLEISKALEPVNDMETVKALETTKASETAKIVQPAIALETAKVLETNLVNLPVKSNSELEKQNNSQSSSTNKDLIALKSQTNSEHSLTQNVAKSPEKLSNIKSILKSSSTEECDKSTIETAKATETNNLEVDISTKTNNELKSSQETEDAKTSETSITTAVKSKRISRFKKGKINLVPRNKTGGQCGSNKTQPSDKKIEAEKSPKELTNVNDSSKESNKKVEVNKISENINKASKVEEKGLSLQSTQITINSEESLSTPKEDKTTDTKQSLTTIRNTEISLDNSERLGTRDSLANTLEKSDHTQTMESTETTAPIQDLNTILNNVQDTANTKDSDMIYPANDNQKLADINEILEDSTKNKQANEIKISQETSQDIGSKIHKKERLEKDNNDALNANNDDMPKVCLRENHSPQKGLTKSPSKSRHQQQTEAALDVTSPILNSPVTKDPQATEISNTKVQISESPATSIPQSNDNIDENIQDNIENIFYDNTTSQLESPKLTTIDQDIDQGSKDILKNMRSAKVSLIDIVKHYPVKSNETSPVIPFKKICKEAIDKTSETTKGIQALLKQLNKNNPENEELSKNINIDKIDENRDNVLNKEETLTKEKEQVNKSLEKVRNITTRRCSRSSSRLSESQEQTPPPPSTKSSTPKPSTNRKRHSNRPLISDDDLEFLPVNAEVKFNLSKSKQNNKSNECLKDLPTLPNTPKSCGMSYRRTRLYSKPLELELSNPNCTPLTKRTRYYSQTLETNVTIEFDTLKTPKTPSTTNTTMITDINSKLLDTEDSCHDSTHDSKILTPNKQRKRLRKTLEDIKKSQKSLADTDSEDDDDDHRDFDCCFKDCEESNAFLGFDENTENNSDKTNPLVVQQKEDNEKSPKTKGGTLKNWLTTGKAIAPTFEDQQEITRIRHDDDEQLTKSSPPVVRAAKSGAGGGVVPLKKRWDLSITNRHEETDITDDTSPADDEEEDEEKEQESAKSISKRFKRGIKNVIDSNKELLDSKKIKLDKAIKEHRFIKPRHLRTSTSKNSGTDSDCHEERVIIAPKAERPKLRVKNFEENSNTKEKILLKEILTESCTDSDYQEVQTRRLRDVNKVTDKLNSDTEIDRPAGRGARGLKRKDKTEIHSANSGIDSDCQDKNETNEQKSKFKKQDHNLNKRLEKTSIAAPDSDVPEARESKRLKSKNKSENSDHKHDTSLLPINSDSDCAKGKRSRRSETKQLADADKVKNLDIPKMNPEDNKNECKDNKSGKKVKSTKKSTKISKKEKQNIDVSEQKDLSAIEKENLSTTADSPKEAENKNEENLSNIKPKIELEKDKPQTTTVKKRKRATKQKLEETPSTSLSSTQKSKIPVKENKLKDSHLPVKRRLSTDTSEDEQSLASSKKRDSKPPAKRKLKIEDSDSDTASTPVKTIGENDSTIDNLKPIATPHLAIVKNETSTPSCGRKRKVDVTESNFNSRLLLITKREQLDTDEVITEINSGTGPIQCGLCLAHTQPSKWTLHLAQHYGVGWKVGEEKLNIENRSVVLNIILNYLKDTGSKALTCRMCKKQYRSGLGILMHIESCGAQVTRVVCEYCKKDYAKTTLPIHMRSCYARTMEKPSEVITEKKEEVFGNTGRLKRNSTLKAENKLKELGEELEKVVDNTNNEKSEIDPKKRIRYVPPLEGDFTTKWLADIAKLGKASCPKKRCKFSSNDIDELKQHLKNCKINRSGYFCNFCRQRAFKTEKEAIEHVIKNHQGGRARKKSDDSDCDLKTDDEQSSDDNDLSEGVDENELDDDDDGEVEDDFDDLVVERSNKRGSRKKNLVKKPYSRNLNQSTNQPYRKEVFDGRFTDLNKEILKKWKSFLKLNYSCEPLYNEFTTQYCVLNQKDFQKYLPTQSQSMKFNFKTNKTLTAKIGEPENNIEWSELKRYESISHKRNTYYFLGAPVKFCSWLPLPDHVNEQYLAVGYRQDMFKFVKILQPKQHHTIILIFKVTQNKNLPQLEVHYGFVVKDGPVHHVAFLPSGGYDETSNRLGLVAVATVNSSIKVYSLPINVGEERKQDPENITLIDVKPKFILNLDILNPSNGLLNTQCLQICWSEYSGHQHIFASFSNGFIGIWDVTNDPENLNRFVVDDLINYAVLNYFYIGEKCVKSFALHYDSNGPRWLAVSGAYRKFIIYDLRCLTQPIIMKEDGNKNILLSMDWCPLWETLLYSYCDSMPNNGRCVMTVNPTNIMFPQNKLDFMVCGVTQVHYTPVTNMCVTSMENGDLLFLDTKELHYECPLSKKFGERRLLYTMDVKHLNGKPLIRLPKGNQKNVTTKVPSEWVLDDDNYKNKYGLVFESLIKLKEPDKSVYLNENRCPPANVTPYMRINTLRCNLNLNAKNLIALGYENGFLRIVDFNKESFLSN